MDHYNPKKQVLLMFVLGNLEGSASDYLSSLLGVGGAPVEPIWAAWGANGILLVVLLAPLVSCLCL